MFKTITGLLLGMLLMFISAGAYNYISKFPPPSEEAKKLITSMKSGNNWRLGRYDDCIVNDTANLVVYNGNFVASIVPNTGTVSYKPSPLETFSFSDRYWVCKAYSEAKKNIEKSNLANLDLDADAVIRSIKSKKGWVQVGHNSIRNKSLGIFVAGDGCVYNGNGDTILKFTNRKDDLVLAYLEFRDNK